MSRVSLTALLLLAVAACHDESAAGPDAGRDAPAGDIVRDVVPDRSDLGGDPLDAVGTDGSRSDGTSGGDGQSADAGKSVDASQKPDDGKKVDASQKPDAGKPDASKPDAKAPPPGLTVPCAHGTGWTLFRFHYGGGSTSPTIDVWDATCSYSYAPSSACNVYAVYPGFGSVSTTSQGYPILTTSEYLRVRFSVAGLGFTKAAVHLQARSYATSSSTYYRVWSPLYGGLVAGSVDNDWVYDWYTLDWSSHLKPTDAPSLTAIQIYADQGSGQLAVQAVELCVQ